MGRESKAEPVRHEKVIIKETVGCQALGGNLAGCSEYFVARTDSEEES
jgi:hypothetical protein